MLDRSLWLCCTALCFVALPLASDAAVPCPEPANPIACPNCMAVLVMPDTQDYTLWQFNSTDNGGNAAHTDEAILRANAAAEWACAHTGDNSNYFVEPSTGKQMPVELVLHLGDMVWHGDREQPMDPAGPCPRNECQWDRIERVFATLDACGVRYLTAPGNHDWDENFEAGAIRSTDLYQRYFPDTPSAGSFPVRAPWDSLFRCNAPDDCDPNAPSSIFGEWYIGGGDIDIGKNRIEMDSRMLEDETPGPPSDQHGRHRVGMLETPAGQHQFLFMGLEFGGRTSTTNVGALEHSTAWPASVLADNPTVPTVLFNHEGIAQGQPEFQDLVAAHSQVFLILNGHIGTDVNFSEMVVDPQPGRSYSVPRLARDRWPDMSGWQEILVFDPDAGEVRVRSVKIDGMHDPLQGKLLNPAIEECDYTLAEETVFLPDVLPRSQDTCPDEPDDQTDTDGDGQGDVCDNCPTDFNDQTDTDEDGLGDACDPHPNDRDNDTVDDDVDNCLGVPNLQQADADGDGVGDACDNCDDDKNSGQADFDGDGIGNVCDLTPAGPAAGTDADNDGIDDASDNCINTPNGASSQCGQMDTDEDGYGNACDADFDGDFFVLPGDRMLFDQVLGGPDTLEIGADLDCNGTVDTADETLFEGFGFEIGDSGLLCAGTPPCIDTDRDRVPDHLDSCVLMATDVHCDDDRDGHGNFCDGDFDDNGFTLPGDVTIMLAGLDSFAEGVTDMDCDGYTLPGDWNRFEPLIPLIAQPGPSGLDCAHEYPLSSPPPEMCPAP